MPQDLTKKDKKDLTIGDRSVINVYDFASVLATALVAIMIIFTFFFRVVGVKGSSMVPTLTDGDWLMVTPLNGKPQYGQVVIVTQPNSFNEPVVKRVIATGEQTIDIRDGSVYVDDVLLDEPFINTDPITGLPMQTNPQMGTQAQYPVTVPQGKVFVMGDNRENSADSRSFMLSPTGDTLGFIDENYILGVVKVRPFNAAKDPVTGKQSFHWYPTDAWRIRQAALTPKNAEEA